MLWNPESCMCLALLLDQTLLENRSAMRTGVACDIRPCDKPSILMDKKISKSDCPIMCTHLV